MSDQRVYRLYAKKVARSVLVGFVSAHVDACFWMGKGPYFERMVTLLRKSFPLGQWVCARDHPMKYCGLIVLYHPHFSTSVHQEDYVDSLEAIALPISK